nr:ceramide synthase 2-like [Danaus plexippus plexippus]
MLLPLLNAFWNEDVWLPPNTTWADLAPGPDKAVIYTDHRHVFFPIPLALVFITLRYILERFVFAPFGRYLGIKDVKPRKPPSNPKLEVAYKTSPRTKQLQRK